MVSVFTYYSDDGSSLTDIESEAQSDCNVLFTSKGDKVIKVCSQSSFSTDRGSFKISCVVYYIFCRRLQTLPQASA